MKIIHALLIAVGLVTVQAGYSAETLKSITVGTGTGSWQLFIVNSSATNNVDKIELVNSNWTEAYIMSQADVSPSFFSLTYNSLKDAFIRSDVLNLQVDYESADPITARKLYRITLTHK